MKRHLLAAVAILGLLGLTGIAEAQTGITGRSVPIPQVTTFAGGDLIQIIPNGYPQAGNQYISATTLLGTNTQVPIYVSLPSNAATVSSPIRAIRGVVSVGTGVTMTSGNLVGVRGEVDLPSGTTVNGASYLYGFQGKFIGGGTTVNPVNIAGVVGQLDVSTGTYTSGVISAGWFDMGATASASAISTGLGTAQIIRLTNTTAAAIPQAIYVESFSTNFMEVHSTGENETWHSATCTPGSVTGGTGELRITIDGVTKWIPLAATCS